MIQTFTTTTDLTAKPTEKEASHFDSAECDDPGLNFSGFAEPSEKTIQAILNYSKNLEVKQSNLVNHVELIKS